jgi:hypothetical protein
MKWADDYRERADHARVLAAMTHQPEIEGMRRRVAQEYDQIADRLDEGNDNPRSAQRVLRSRS